MQQSTCCVPTHLNVAYRSMKMLLPFGLLSGITFCVNKVQLHFALACVASVSLPCRSKDRGTTVKDRPKNGSRFISRAAKTGLSLLRNQAKWKRLPRRRYILRYCYILWRNSVSQRNVLWNVEKMQAATWTLLLLVFLIKLSCLRSEFFII